MRSSPFKYGHKVTGTFGHNHSGADLVGLSKEGKPLVNPAVFSLQDGQVERIVRDHWKGGNFIFIKDNEGLWYYGHLKDILVGHGESVGESRVIGHQGATGQASGPHLHLGRMAPNIYGYWVDPLPLLGGDENMTKREADLRAYKLAVSVAGYPEPNQEAIDSVNARLDNGENIEGIVFDSWSLDRRLPQFIEKLVARAGEGGFRW